MSEEAAKASVFIGKTENLGDYESLTIKVGVTIPCETNEVPEMLDRAKELAKNKVIEYFKEALGE